MKVSHIFDDAIISLSTIDLFRKIRKYNQEYYIITEDLSKWAHIVKARPYINLIESNSKVVSEIVKVINSSDVIVFQALSYEKAKSIVKSNSNNKVYIWALWGYGLYNIVNYYSDNSGKNLSTEDTIKKGIIDKLKEFYTFSYIYKSAVKKIDYCLFLLEYDFKLLKDHINTKAEWHTSCYHTLDNIFKDGKPFQVERNKVLIGNSSTPSNRHEEIFDKLKGVDLSNRELIVPLSYGDMKYRNRIIELGKGLFDFRFNPLLDFMDEAAYGEVLKQCSHVILAHQRQQAFGTIVTMLLAGAKVFLSEDSPFFDWFKQKEVIIYSVEKDLLTEIQSDLSKEAKQINFERIKELLNEDIILMQLENLLTKAIQKNENR